MNRWQIGLGIGHMQLRIAGSNSNRPTPAAWVPERSEGHHQPSSQIKTDATEVNCSYDRPDQNMAQMLRQGCVQR